MRENSELGQKSIFAKVAISRKHLFSDRLAKNGVFQKALVMIF